MPLPRLVPHAEVDLGAQRKALDLTLGASLGPYSLDYTRSGRFVALAGRKGHLAMLDWHRLTTVCELQVGSVSSCERVLPVVFRRPATPDGAAPSSVTAQQQR